MKESKDGWVRYDAHMKEVTRQQAEIERLREFLGRIKRMALKGTNPDADHQKVLAAIHSEAFVALKGDRDG